MSGHDMVCFDKTFEAAEALLHMESPGGLHNERSTGKDCTSSYNLLLKFVFRCECGCEKCKTEGVKSFLFDV